MPTIQELAAKINRQAVAGLARNVRAMPADKQTWKPMDVGRDVLDQAKECAAINFIVRDMLQTGSLPDNFQAAYGRYCGEAETPEQIVTLLEQSGEALANAIEEFPADDLEQTLQMPWDDKPSTFAEIMVIPYWNTAYHIGQACYVQTLYGDREMH